MKTNLPRSTTFNIRSWTFDVFLYCPSANVHPPSTMLLSLCPRCSWFVALLLLASLPLVCSIRSAQPANGTVHFDGEVDFSSPFERWRQLHVINWVDVTSLATVKLRVIGGTLKEQDFAFDDGKVLSNPPSGNSRSSFDISLKEGW